MKNKNTLNENEDWFEIIYNLSHREVEWILWHSRLVFGLPISQELDFTNNDKYLRLKLISFIKRNKNPAKFTREILLLKDLYYLPDKYLKWFKGNYVKSLWILLFLRINGIHSNKIITDKQSIFEAVEEIFNYRYLSFEFKSNKINIYNRVLAIGKREIVSPRDLEVNDLLEASNLYIGQLKQDYLNKKIEVINFIQRKWNEYSIQEAYKEAINLKDTEGIKYEYDYMLKHLYVYQPNSTTKYVKKNISERKRALNPLVFFGNYFTVAEHDIEGRYAHIIANLSLIDYILDERIRPRYINPNPIFQPISQEISFIKPALNIFKAGQYQNQMIFTDLMLDAKRKQLKRDKKKDDTLPNIKKKNREKLQKIAKENKTTEQAVLNYIIENSNPIRIRIKPKAPRKSKEQLAIERDSDLKLRGMTVVDAITEVAFKILCHSNKLFAIEGMTPCKTLTLTKP